uniref:EH domain binding protein epsin n=1 Tax=Trepomonas sp. PC1 TaxID=1076344 RepID=A0A146K312_9EUKA|eukprot:JAP90838.1 EH domain binding protein epsin [Trepomonas sp. PC1]
MKMAFLKLTEEELKVVNATSEKVAWGPTTQEMDEITDMTRQYEKKRKILDKIHEQLRHTEKLHWKNVYKSLLLVEHMCIHADMECVNFFKQNVHTVQQLRDNYRFRDEDGSDKGINVRKRAETVADLITDEDLDQKREEGQAQKQKFTASVGNVGGSNVQTGAPFGNLPKQSRFESGFGSSNYQAPPKQEYQEPRKPAVQKVQEPESDNEPQPVQRTQPVPIKMAGPKLVAPVSMRPAMVAPQPAPIQQIQAVQEQPKPKQVDLLEDLFGTSEPIQQVQQVQVQQPAYVQPQIQPVQQQPQQNKPQVKPAGPKPDLSSLLDF